VSIAITDAASDAALLVLGKACADCIGYMCIRDRAPTAANPLNRRDFYTATHRWCAKA